MKNEYLDNIKESDLQVGEILLTEHPGGDCKYKKAINVPGYGWIPCALRLQIEFTTNPKELVIVHLDEEDAGYTWSDIWITRTTSRVIKEVDLWEDD